MIIQGHKVSSVSHRNQKFFIISTESFICKVMLCVFKAVNDFCAANRKGSTKVSSHLALGIYLKAALYI